MNEITKYDTSIYDRIDNPITAFAEMGKWYVESDMFGCTRKAQGNILAMATITERKSPIVIANTYHIMDGQLTMKSRAMLAFYRQAGGKVKWLETTDTICRAAWTFEGDTCEIGFTFAEAERMGIVKPKGGWFKQPAEMLRARATSRAVTMLCPEILVGGGVEDDNQASPSEPAQNPLTVIASEGVAIAGGGEAVVVSANFSDPLDGPAPKPEPKAKTKSEAATVIDAAVATDNLTIAQLAKILEIVSDCELAAVAWMVDREWIPSAEDVEKLSAANAQLVIDKPEKFKRAIAKFAAEQS
jgi:hypothetical protein